VDNNYYVYVFLDPRKPGKYKYAECEFTHEPFYIGKGKDYRDKKHLYHYIKNENDQTLKYRKMRKILKEGHDPIIKRIYDGLDEKTSFILEEQLIKDIGRIDKKNGPLANHTNGGEGCSGRKLSEQTKNKISESVKNSGRVYKPHTIEYKKMMSKLMSGRISPMKGKIQSEKAKRKISENHSKHRTRSVIRMDKDGNYIDCWDSMSNVSDVLNISLSGICNCCNGKNQTCGGYKWKYED
jgi:hypothetical protein